MDASTSEMPATLTSSSDIATNPFTNTGRQPTTDDIAVGVAMTVSSILCIIPNIIVIRVSYRISKI